MKELIAFIALSILSVPAFANSADLICSVSGTSISFDLASGSPADEGSRSFQELFVSKSGNLDKPDLSIEYDSSRYIIQYADGVLNDGARYFSLSIMDRKNFNDDLYAFSRDASKERPAYSTFYSTLPDLNIPMSAHAVLNCN